MNAFFKKNMNRVDRVFRLVLAIVLLVLASGDATGGVLALVLGTVSVILIVTGMSGTCPLYSAVGRGTGPRPVH